MPVVAQWRSRLETPAQRRKRIRKLSANKLRKKERAAHMRYLHAQYALHVKTRKGHYELPYEGIWRVDNWDFNLNISFRREHFYESPEAFR